MNLPNIRQLTIDGIPLRELSADGKLIWQNISHKNLYGVWTMNSRVTAPPMSFNVNFTFGGVSCDGIVLLTGTGTQWRIQARTTTGQSINLTYMYGGTESTWIASSNQLDFGKVGQVVPESVFNWLEANGTWEG